MSKIKNYNRTLYESIESGLRELMKPYRLDKPEEILACIYTPDAYEQAAAFLCINDIPHTFSICPINSKLRARVVIVTWTENDGGECNLAWWEETNGKD